MPEVLNRSLYRRLKRLYGHVRVANEGESFLARAIRGLENEPLLAVDHVGEYYRICCPFCDDTRYRLWVSHVFGKRDQHGRKMNFFAICYNENCLNKLTNREDFVESLQQIGGDLEDVKVRKGKVVPEEAREVAWPGPYQRLDTLKPNHKARRYLETRSFDPDYIARRYEVGYCLESNYFLAKKRLVIPVFERGKLKGWQARYVGELPWKDKVKKQGLPPKYFSAPGSHFRSRCIYNFDRMREWETGVIVEGPTDVWRFGSMAGCIFGNTVTEHQRRKLLSIFRRRTLVLLLDPEEYNSPSTLRCVKLLTRKMPGHFCAIKLPAGTDPGALDRDFLHAYVKAEARKQGVRVAYVKHRRAAA